MSPTDVIDHPPVEEPDTDAEPRASHAAVLMRRPDVPVNVNELAALKGEAIEIIDARVLILATLRKAAIRSTSPEDWLLFKAPDDQGGQIVGYLQDCGADRVRDLYGIDVYKVSEPVKISGNDPRSFMYLISANGRCKFTRQIVEQIEGGRSSTDDFCKDKSGAELELAVRKAARANLDGNITRELASMKSVPIEELKEAWVGTNKRVEQCRHGRGFGSRNERLGANTTRGGAPDVEPPICPHCKSKGVYRPSKDGRPAFYGCPNYAKHSDKKFIVNAEEWVAKAQAKPATASEPAASAPLTASDVFGNGSSRQPGEDG